MRQKAMTKHYEHETPDTNQVKNQRLHNLHNLRGACDLAPSLRVGFQAYPNMRRRKASHQVTLPQIPLEVPGPVDMFRSAWRANLRRPDPVLCINACFQLENLLSAVVAVTP